MATPVLVSQQQQLETNVTVTSNASQLQRKSLWASETEEKQTIELLSNSFINSLEAPVEHLGKQLKEIESAQRDLLKNLDLEKQKLDNVPEFQHVSQTVKQTNTTKIGQLKF